MKYTEWPIVLVLVLGTIALAIVIKASFERRRLQKKTINQKPSANSSQLTISDACEQILRDSDNNPLTLDDLHSELSKCGTICSKAVLEFVLLDEFLKFSVDHSSECHMYRLSSAHLDQNP